MNNHVQVASLPPGVSRVETGAVQFGDDWPGLFIRGDEAFALMLKIRQLGERLAGHPDFEVGDTLEHLVNYADLIQRDVIVGNRSD